jgi:hypothetical protein
MKRMPAAAMAVVLLLASSSLARAQQAGVDEKRPAVESTATSDPLSQLNPDQRKIYDAATRQFSSELYPDAFAAFKTLMEQLPPGPTRLVLSKYASEAALNIGDYSFARNTLVPMFEADRNDWQAVALLARLYAETGDKQARDAALAQLVDLHKRAVSPPIAQMKQILIERISIPNGFIRVWYSLEPWGSYKTYLFCRVFNTSGQQVLRVTLESADFDQPQFAKEHPDLAAAGARRFSLDGFGQEEKMPDGTVKGTHMTFGFFDGQPAYDTVRQQVIEIAKGSRSAMSKTEHNKSQ